MGNTVRCSNPHNRKRILSSFECPDQLWNPPSQLKSGSFSVLKRPGLRLSETIHLLPLNTFMEWTRKNFYSRIPKHAAEETWLMSVRGFPLPLYCFNPLQTLPTYISYHSAHKIRAGFYYQGSSECIWWTTVAIGDRTERHRAREKTWKRTGLW